MKEKTKKTWQCGFTRAAYRDFKDTCSENIVKKGRNPIYVEAENEIEAKVEFMKKIEPARVEPTFILAKREEKSLLSYMICNLQG